MLIIAFFVKLKTIKRGVAISFLRRNPLSWLAGIKFFEMDRG